MKVDRRAALMAGLYAVAGVAWIALSDQTLQAMVPDAAMVSVLAQGKGFAFVLATAGLLYGVAARRPVAPAPPGVVDSQIHTARRGALLLVFAALAAAIVLAGLLGVAHNSGQLREDESDKLRAIASLKAAQWNAWLDDRHADARRLYGDAEFARLSAAWQARADAALDAELLARMRSYCLETPCEDVLLLDDRGTLLLRSNPVSRVARAALPSLVREAISRREIVDSGLYGGTPPQSPQALVDIVVPFALSGARPAALVLRFDAQRALHHLLTSWPGRRGNAEVVLFRADGEDLLFFDLGDAAMRREQRARSGLWFAHAADAPQPSEAMLQGTSLHGGTALGAALAVPGTEWLVGVQVDQAVLYGQAGSDARWIVFADVLALMMAAAAVYALYQRLELRAERQRRAEQAEKLHALQMLDAIANGSTDAIYAKDAAGRYTFANREAARLFDQEPQDLIGRDGWPPGCSDKAEELAATHLQIMASGLTMTHELSMVVGAQKRTFHCVVGPMRDAAGAVNGVFGICRDISERKRDEEVRRQWAMAFQSTRDGVIIADTRGRIVEVNRAFSEITGYSVDDVRGRTPRILQSGRHDARFYGLMWRALRESGAWQGEIWNRRRCGEIYPEWLTISSVRDESGELTHYVGVFTDISRLKQSEAQLERLAHYDPLTDLPNRRLLQLRLEHAIERGRRHGKRVAVLYIDLDGFKTVNDSLGHPAGDELLLAVARRLRSRMREEDTLGRLGGDEFLVVLESLNEAGEAAVVARDLLRAVAEPLRLSGGQEALVTASAGISIHPDNGNGSAVELLRDADAAMYRAKSAGRNCFRFYTSDLHAQAVERLEIEAALGRALERGEFRLHYQPQVDARTGRIVGAEALLRWQRQDVGMVPPGRFIAAAERSGQILAIGHWVIDTACRQMREWLDAGLDLPRVSINISARQFTTGGLDLQLHQALLRHRVAPELLEIELTESMLVEHPADTEAMLQRLKVIGVKVALDDFGTGYSSLGYLHRFPIDTLKIDQSFVRGIDGDGATIVDAIIGLAHRMHLRVIAEGVETMQQQAYLLHHGCDELQGFRFARPMPPEELAALLREGIVLPQAGGVK